MRLIVCPVSHSPTTDASSASGMLRTTTNDARQSRRKTSTIKPVRAAPSIASKPTPDIASVTTGDWSKANSIFTSSGTRSCIRGMAAFSSLTTSSVEASGRLVTSM